MRRLGLLDSLALKSLLATLRSWLGASSGDRPSSAAEPLGHAGPPRVPVCGAPRVLVVDDNPANLMLMSAMLESQGLASFLAEDGAQAVALASALRFDLILMDLQMPILDGLAATSAIRRI